MIPRLPKLVRRLEASRNGRLPDLGERELSVLEVLWQGGEATAQSVLGQMPGGDLSLSTVQSTLERLHRKDLLERTKQGRAYRYRAALDRAQLISALLRDMANDVAAGDLAPMLSGFLDYVSAEAPELVAELSKALGVSRAGDRPKEGDDD